jgi:hypothetical protein
VSAAANLTVRGIQIEDRSDLTGPCTNAPYGVLTPCGANQTFDDVVVDGVNRRDKHGIQSPGNGFVFRNGEVRNIVDYKGFEGGADNMLIEHNWWHDIRIATDGVHNECAYITDGNNQTWRGNRFDLCPVMAMFFANWLGGSAFGPVIIENNVFTHSLNDDLSWHEGSSFVIPAGSSGNNQVNNWVVRYNTFEVPPQIYRTPGTGDDNGSALFYGNLGADPSCNLPEWTLSYNVGTTCGRPGEIFVPNATNTRQFPNQAPFYVNALQQDFHLRSGTNAAVNFGAPIFPPLDLDGNTRPFGPSVDAGAYERQN